MTRKFITTLIIALGNVLLLCTIFSTLLIMLIITISFILGIPVLLYENNPFIAWIEFLLVLISLIAITRQLFLVMIKIE